MIKSARVLILLLLLGSGFDAFSQHLSHQVLVPAAGVASTSLVGYSQTIGETAVELISNSQYDFTQGFQQPAVKLTNIIPPAGNGVDVFPNPVIDDLTIKLFGDVARDFRVEIININGTIVISEKVSFYGEYYYEKIVPVANLKRGIYFIRVISEDKLINRTFKIDKM